MTSLRRFHLSATGMALAIGLAAGVSGPAAAQTTEVEREKIGDWTIRCLEGTEDCRMTQIGKVGEEDALLVSIQRLADTKMQNGTEVAAAMQVQAPLGILIPYGVRLKIDQGETAGLNITRCLPIGCVAGAPMTDEAVALLKKGATANFTYVLQNETAIGISLSGFTKAYESLKPMPRETQ